MCPPKAHRGMVKKVLPDFFFGGVDGVDHGCIHKTVHVQDKDHSNTFNKNPFQLS